MLQKYQLAQVNIAKAKEALDQPIMQGFVQQLAHINQLAEASPGFIWRLQTESGDATALKVFEDELLIVNLSVWDSFESLKEYVYSGEHLTVLKNKKHWFDKHHGPSLALWWIPKGHIPSIESAKNALAQLASQGPSPQAFTFAKPYLAPNQQAAKLVE
ncbi:DUF3291 domain-containing protein [Iodobacter sp. CM08]|uniref:DUF3291 domain-containing protein n=1 Tax=Iodobacter sp. CM08 TaxID=3085902 RepID=UPI002981880D|nr:DUF3291 domain-containing protein [Iodobacter sp. CM08]MDW5416376.1 DUF3291 domain-containing protein [Iodobacter sp. CM08]